MKIARIKEIKNIGTFANFTNGASLGFEKLTFIYGFNTYGKTTLIDIFQSLKNNNWTHNDISKHLEVFGTDFMHRNLFTGSTIERDNRVNLTQFILGEQGVRLAGEIATKKKELGDKRRDLKTKAPNF